MTRYLISHRQNGMLLVFVPGASAAYKIGWTRRLERATLFDTFEQAVSFQREHDQGEHVTERLDNLSRQRTQVRR